MSEKKTDEKKAETPSPLASTEKKKDVVVVRMLRRVHGIVNNVGEVCGFPKAMADKLTDKSRPGGPAAELYTPQK